MGSRTSTHEQRQGTKAFITKNRPPVMSKKIHYREQIHVKPR
jgi:hypothetical protein